MPARLRVIGFAGYCCSFRLLFGYVRMTPKNKGRLLVALVVMFSPVIVFVAWLWRDLGPGGSGTLAWLRLPDGSEYVITQKYNWSMEPYTVSFYQRAGEGPWGWNYVDHEALRWREVAMTYDPGTDEVIVTEQGKRRVVLDRKKKSLWLDNGDGSIRHVRVPQEMRTPEFAQR
jgi:hypothetical protein